MRTALGFRAHSGWAAMVAVAGTMNAPLVLERRRIVIADPEKPGSKQPYHAAAELPFFNAETLVRTAIESSRAFALEAMLATVTALQSQGHEIAGCALLLGSGKALPGLEKILASHALIHTAEGEMFRDVLVWAARECRLPVTAVQEKGLKATLLKRIGSLGKQIGPPWTQDQKYATLAALLALEGG
ncbi:MAG TPA: hypothetical protein VK604_04270 [Bryobacteraceae bacterium]|nr:hypothetical protein [Bryobacteraceae bacterium]